MRLAINGFGRIGRQAFKVATNNPKIEVVAINDISSPKVLAHLLKYDSAYGVYQKEIRIEEIPAGADLYNNQDIISNAYLVVDGKKTLILSQKDPTLLPWKKLQIDVVLECTGRLTKNSAAKAHIEAGAKGVVVSAPVSESPEINTYLVGVNNKELGSKCFGPCVISNASCTTNCIAPVIKVMDNNFKVLKALMTTIHAATAEQNLVDGAPPGLHPDLRRARSAINNIIPTTTGAAKAVGEVIPNLKGIFDGLAIRVPIITGSLSDITMLVGRKTTREEVIDIFVQAEKLPEYRGVLQTTFEPIVSSDIIGNPHSAIVDLSLTKVIDGDLVKIIAWYDNEWGYANRLVEMAMLLFEAEK